MKSVPLWLGLSAALHLLALAGGLWLLQPAPTRALHAPATRRKPGNP